MKNKISGRKQKKNRVAILLIAIILLIIILIVIKLNNNTKINNEQQNLYGMQDIYVANNTKVDIANLISQTANKPELSAGMIPIKQVNGKWVITTSDDKDWYDYTNNKPAYIMINDGRYTSEILSLSSSKEKAVAGTSLTTSTMGTVFVWIPRFAYSSLSEDKNIIYLKEETCVAGEYITSELFTYYGSGIGGQDIALNGIWIEQSGELTDAKVTSFNQEDNTYGFIGNIKAKRISLDTQFVSVINNQISLEAIKNIERNRAIIKVINEKKLEPIMATTSHDEGTVTLTVIKAVNGIDKVINSAGQELTRIEGTNQYTENNVSVSGIYKYIVIDKLGNQRQFESKVTFEEIKVVSNVDNYVEYNGVKWYPVGTVVELNYREDISKITPYYQEINGTTLEPVDWIQDNVQTRTITIDETTKFKIRLENQLLDVSSELEETIHIMPSEKAELPESYMNNIGGTYPVRITSSSTNSEPKGTQTYSYDTFVSYAALHMGLVDGLDGEVVYIKIVPSPQGGYYGSTRNGVTTQNGTTNINGYIFITENGEEIKAPEVTSVSLTLGETSITATVNTKAYNTNISKYYYKIDDGEFIESQSKSHEFTEVAPYMNHTITVCVRDTNGAISTESTAIGRVTKAILLPSIEIVDEENIQTVEYGGKTWYPYGTEIKITYAEDMTNLTGEWNCTDIEGDWGWSTGITASESIIKIGETSTYYARIKDETGAYSKTVQTDQIYIMPRASLQYDYAYYTLGEIYPVYVSYNSEDSLIYGLNTYRYNSNIAKAAEQMGLITKEDTKPKLLYIKATKCPEEYYKSYTLNEVTSTEYQDAQNGFVFVDENEKEIKKYPIITNTTLSETLEQTTITVEATAYNDASISKYYYSLNGSDFEESDSNTKVFEASNTTFNTIKVYVEDSDGLKSAIKTRHSGTTSHSANFADYPRDTLGQEWTTTSTDIYINNTYKNTNGSIGSGWNSACVYVDLTMYPSDTLIKITATGSIIWDSDCSTSNSYNRIQLEDLSTGKYIFDTSISKGQSKDVSGSEYVYGGKRYILRLWAYKQCNTKTHWLMAHFKTLSYEIVGVSNTSISMSTSNSATTYNDEKWYPFGTTLYISRNGEDSGSYSYINSTTGAKIDSGTFASGSTASKSIELTTTGVAIAKVGQLDKTMHYNIMPNPAGMHLGDNQSSYYDDSNIGKIYPVEVTGQTYNSANSGVWGTQKYWYMSNINMAATQMGLVNVGETKVVYIKIVPSQEMYSSSLHNAIQSNSISNPTGNGFVFVDEEGNEIKEITKPTINNTITIGSDIQSNGSHYFVQDGTTLIPNNVGVSSTTANSYIEIDLRDYIPEDSIRLILNASVSSEETYDWGYATIREDITAPAYDSTEGRFIYISGTVSAQDYETILEGGKLYYLHLGYRKDGGVDTGLDRVEFSNLRVEKVMPYATLSGYPVYQSGDYYFVQNGTAIKSNNSSVSSRGYAYSYIVLDLTKDYTENDSVKVILNAQDNTASYNYTFAHISTTRENFEYSNTEGRFAYLNNTAAGDYLTIVPGGKVYYLCLGYYKDTTSTHSSYYGQFNSLTVEKQIPNATLSGYPVYQSGANYFEQNETAIKSNNSLVPSKGYAYSYIVLDLTKDYTENDFVKVTLNARNYASGNCHMFAHISTTGKNFEYSNTEGRVSSISNLNGTADHFTIVPGGKVYYLCLGYYKDTATISSSYYGQFNSLTVEKQIPNATLSGYPVYQSGNYCFEQNGTAIRSNVSGNSNKEYAYSYIVLDLTKDYTENDSVKVTLNAQNGSSSTYNYTFAHITSTKGVFKYSYSNTEERFVYLNGSGARMDYSTIVLGGKVYYLCLGYYKNTTSQNSSYYGQFNSLTVEPFRDYDNIGEIYEIQVTDKTSGVIYGTNVYEAGSDIETAATHMGLVKAGETKLVYIKIVQSPEGGYIGSTRNGITTETSSSTLNGFVFVDENGNEINRPKITATTTVSSENSITVTVNAQSKDTRIVNYYYSINNGEYVKSNDSHYTFENIQNSLIQTIKIYAVDNKGQETPIKELTAIRKIPVPIIQVNGTAVEYNGEMYYPYGTTVTIKYSTNMTNLKGHYKAIKLQSSTTDGWETTTNSEVTVTLTESCKYDAYCYDSTLKEGMRVSKTINILPNE